MLRLLVGLGNPGPEYDATRHNAGFWWIDAVARKLGTTLVAERSYHGLVARVNRPAGPLWLLEPQTYMNVSGKSVAALARFFKIAPGEILVAHDELDLPPGRADAPTAFDRFGIITTWIDGNAQRIYFDDLQYTCRQE